MRRRKNGSVWMILPLYIFTLIFVAGPLVYMAALSFATPNAGYGVSWNLTLNNYKKIFRAGLSEYLSAVLSACHYQYAGHQPDRLSLRLFYGKAS